MARNHLPCQPVSSSLHPLVAVGTRVAEHGGVCGEPCPAPSLAGTRVWGTLDAHLLEGVSVLAQISPHMSSSLKAVSEATQFQTCFAVSDN